MKKCRYDFDLQPKCNKAGILADNFDFFMSFRVIVYNIKSYQHNMTAERLHCMHYDRVGNRNRDTNNKSSEGNNILFSNSKYLMANDK